MNPPPAPSESTVAAARSVAAPAQVAADPPQLHSHLAKLAEAGEGATRSLLEFIRSIVNGRAVALLPAGGAGDPSEACIVTTRGIPAGEVAALGAALCGRALIVQPLAKLGADVTLVAVPIVRQQVERQWLIAILAPQNVHELPGIAALLQALAGFLLYRDERSASRELEHVLVRMSSLLEVIRRLGVEEDFAKACRVAVDEVRGYLGCSRVILGLRNRGSVQVRAISGASNVDVKSPAHQSIESAMREAIHAGRRIDFHAGNLKSSETLAHEILAQSSGVGRIVTLPLPGGRGALMLEWAADAAADPTGERLLEATAPMLPPVFDLLFRARPNATVFAARRWWRASGERRRRVIIGCAAALGLLLLFPFHYRIGADCRLVPQVKRVIAAPFEGQLKKSHVQPGDHVTEGQALAEMDNRELRLREAELLAARERALKQRDKAMSNTGEGADFASAQVADFEARSVGEELALVQRKLALLEIKSPLTGVVLTGDLRRDEGRPVQQGQVMFEVAPLAEMLVEIDAPDREVSRVRAGVPITFRLDAFGGGTREGRIARVHPQSEPRDGRNVFICEAPVTNPGELRPGMRGRARIESDRRPLIWILGHRLWEWVATTIWW